MSLDEPLPDGIDNYLFTLCNNGQYVASSRYSPRQSPLPYNLKLPCEAALLGGEGEIVHDLRLLKHRVGHGIVGKHLAAALDELDVVGGDAHQHGAAGDVEHSDVRVDFNFGSHGLSRLSSRKLPDFYSTTCQLGSSDNANRMHCFWSQTSGLYWAR